MKLNYNKLLVISLLLLLLISSTGCLDNAKSKEIQPKHYKLSIITKGKGIVTTTPERKKYKPNSEVTLTAKSQEDYTFDHWEGSGFDQNTNKSITVTVTEDIRLVAVFKKKINHAKTVTVSEGSIGEEYSKLSLPYSIKMDKFETTHLEFLNFLNSIDIGADLKYKGKFMVKDFESFDNNTIKYSSAHDKFIFTSKDWARDKRCPIQATWCGAMAYCNWLSKKKGLEPAYDLAKWELKGKPKHLEGYRLPTKKEWLYAAKGGKNGIETTYAGANDTIEIKTKDDKDDKNDPLSLELQDVAWCEDNSKGRSHPVGQKFPNELNLYDMNGNLNEWIHNREYPDNYEFIGGDFFGDGAPYILIGHTRTSLKYYTLNEVGFRIVKSK